MRIQTISLMKILPTVKQKKITPLFKLYTIKQKISYVTSPQITIKMGRYGEKKERKEKKGCLGMLKSLCSEAVIEFTQKNFTCLKNFYIHASQRKHETLRLTLTFKPWCLTNSCFLQHPVNDNNLIFKIFPHDFFKSNLLIYQNKITISLRLEKKKKVR